MCIFIFLTAVTSNSSEPNNSGRYNLPGYSCKVFVILVWLYPNLYFLRFQLKKPPILSIVKICPTEAGLFHADSHAKTTKFTVFFFSKFANAPEEPQIYALQT